MALSPVDDSQKPSPPAMPPQVGLQRGATTGNVHRLFLNSQSAQQPAVTKLAENNKVSSSSPQLTKGNSEFFRKTLLTSSQSSLSLSGINSTKKIEIPELPVDRLYNELDFLRRLNDSKNDALRLKQCLDNHPNDLGKIVEIVCEIREKTHHPNRLQKMLIAFLLLPGSKSFLRDYFADKPAELLEFVEAAFSSLNKHPSRTEIISECIDADLETGTEDDLFPLPCLSTMLYVEFGRYFLEDRLKTLCKKINNRQSPPMILQRNEALKKLEKDSEYKKLVTEDEQEIWIKGELDLGATHFVEFIPPVLEEIYSLEISVAFSDLLGQLRMRIIQFYQKTDSKNNNQNFENAIRVHFAKLVFLGLVNPSLKKNSSLKPFVASLTLFLEHLAQEKPFNVEENSHEVFNSLYDKCIGVHREFIRKCAAKKT